QKLFDFILCDVPCSGSGTWARSPENFYFSPSEKDLNTFEQVQKNIVSHAVKHLKDDGYLVYVTCSVFAQENENIINHLMEHTTLALVESQLINGIPHKADIMYYAVLQKKKSN